MLSLWWVIRQARARAAFVKYVKTEIQPGFARAGVDFLNLHPTIQTGIAEDAVTLGLVVTIQRYRAFIDLARHKAPSRRMDDWLEIYASCKGLPTSPEERPRLGNGAQLALHR